MDRVAPLGKAFFAARALAVVSAPLGPISAHDGVYFFFEILEVLGVRALFETVFVVRGALSTVSSLEFLKFVVSEVVVAVVPWELVGGVGVVRI